MRRRDFLKCVAAAGTAIAWPGSYHGGSGATRRPNFVVILTDQERQHRHWPTGFVDRFLPSWGRLQKNGLTFERAYTASAQCSPSRACFLTGHYSNVNKVPTFDFPGGLPGKDELPNIGSWLKEKAGYEVVWKGKWHLSFPQSFEGGSPDQEVWTAEDIAYMENHYGLSKWNPPEAGNNVQNTAGARATMGGGDADNDRRYTVGEANSSSGATPGLGESAVDYVRELGRKPAQSRPPFCLFVSLVNPHDIAFFPNGWDLGGYRLEDFQDLDINLPPNFADDLSTKPGIQKTYHDYLQSEGPLNTDEERLNYVKFYAWLHTLSDALVNQLLDALDETGLTQDAIIVRTADHGELGLSHGLREKSYAVYDEILNIPLVISNPLLFPSPRTTKAVWSHVDLAATLADLAGVPQLGVGVSQTPVIAGLADSARSDALFCYDDVFFLPADEPGSHIRALRDGRYTYAVYFSSDGSLFEYELYDNDADPHQMTNLTAEPTPEITALWKALHLELKARITACQAEPTGFAWPDQPV